MTDAITTAQGLGYDVRNPDSVVGYVGREQQAQEADTAPIRAENIVRLKKNRGKIDDLADKPDPMDEVKPWSQKMPEPDPLQGMASVGAIFAGIAAGFTHTPAVNAMNGMAAAINAVRKGQIDEYHDAYNTWKENTQVAIDRSKMLHAKIQEALELLNTDTAAGAAQLKMIAAEHGDHITNALANAGDWAKLAQMQTARAEASQRMAAGQSEVSLTLKRNGIAMELTKPETTPERREELQRELHALDMARPGATLDAERIRQMGANRASGKPLTAMLDDGTKISVRWDPQLSRYVDLNNGEPVTNIKEIVPEAKGSQNPKTIAMQRFLETNPDASPEELQKYLSSLNAPDEGTAARKQAVIDLGVRAQQNKETMSRENLDFKKLSEADRYRIQEGHLDLSKLTLEQRKKIDDGKLELAQLSEADRKAIGWAGLDLKAIAEENRKEATNRRLDLSQLSYGLRKEIDEGRLSLAQLSEADRTKIGWAGIDLKAIESDRKKTADENRDYAARENLSLKGLTEEHRNAFNNGMLDLRRMSAEDLKAWHEGTLDLNTWAKHELISQGARRLVLQEDRDKATADYRRVMGDRSRFTGKPVMATITMPDGTVSQQQVLRDQQGRYFYNNDPTQRVEGRITNTLDTSTPAGMKMNDAAILAMEEWRNTHHGQNPTSEDMASPEMAALRRHSEQNVNPLPPETADFQAKEYLRTGILAGGFGLASAKLQIMNAATRIAQEEGRTVEDYLAGRATWKADVASLGAVTKQKNAAQGYERGAMEAMDLAVRYLPKTAEPLSMPLLTRFVREGASFLGSVDVPVYMAQLISGLDQYAKVLAGSTGAAAATDGARNLALSLIPPGATTAQVKGVVAAMKRDMEAKVNGYNAQEEDIRRELRMPGGSGMTPAGKSGGGSGVAQHKVGDVVMQGGKKYKVTAVDKDGKAADAVEVPK